MDSVIDWLNDNSGAVQAIATVTLVIVTAVLVGATTVYARSTRRMAREMERARRDSLRPIIVIKPSSRTQSTLTAKIDNYGVGPALDLWFLCVDGETTKENRMSVLAVDEDVRSLRIGGWIGGSWPLFVDQPSGQARIHYRDVFGNDWTAALKLKGFKGRTRDEMVTTEGWPEEDD